MRAHFRLYVLGLAAAPVTASADSLGRPCTDKPESQHLTPDALMAKLIEQGYQIRNGEIRKTCREFCALEKNGSRAEPFVDPTTGKIVAGEGRGAKVMTGDDRETSPERGCRSPATPSRTCARPPEPCPDERAGGGRKSYLCGPDGAYAKPRF